MITRTAAVFIGELDALARAVAELPREDLDASRRYTAVRRVRQFLGGRALLRLAIGDRLGHAPASLHLTTVNERPRVAELPELSISLSHSGERVACAVFEGEACGVDLQRKVNKPLLDIASQFFMPGEHVTLAALDAGARADLFYEAWTLKEAWAKASGADLLDAMSRVRAAGREETPTVHWQAWRFSPAPDAAAALVVGAGPDDAIAPSIAVWRGEAFEPALFACKPVALYLKDA